MSEPIIIKKSEAKGKKFRAIVEGKTINFGDSEAEDYTMHNDKERRSRYIARHQKNEQWTKSGIKTAGFWSRWLLWNKKSIKASIDDIERSFNVKIKLI